MWFWGVFFESVLWACPPNMVFPHRWYPDNFYQADVSLGKIQIFLNNVMFQRVCSGICWALGRSSLILVDWRVLMGSCDFRFPEAVTLSDMEVPKKRQAGIPACTDLFWKAPVIIIATLPQSCLTFGKSISLYVLLTWTCQPIGDYSSLLHRAVN